MEVKNLYNLAEIVIKQDAETAAKIIKQYGNDRAEKAISDAWEIARKFYFKVAKSRYARLKDKKLIYDQENDCVNMVDLIDYISSVWDIMSEISEETKCVEVKAVLEYLEDEMSAKLDERVNIDRRNLFSKRAEEAKDRTNKH